MNSYKETEGSMLYEESEKKIENNEGNSYHPFNHREYDVTSCNHHRSQADQKSMFHPKHPCSVRVKSKRHSSFRFSKRWTKPNGSSLSINSSSSLTSAVSETVVSTSTIETTTIKTSNDKHTAQTKSKCSSRDCPTSPRSPRFHAEQNKKSQYHALEEDPNEYDSQCIRSNASTSSKGGNSSTKFPSKRSLGIGTIFVRERSDTTCDESSSNTNSPTCVRSKTSEPCCLPRLEQDNLQTQQQQRLHSIKHKNVDGNNNVTINKTSPVSCLDDSFLSNLHVPENISHPSNPPLVPSFEPHSVSEFFEDRILTAEGCFETIPFQPSHNASLDSTLKDTAVDNKHSKPGVNSSSSCSTGDGKVESNNDCFLRNFNYYTGPVDVDSVLEDELAEQECRIMAQKTLVSMMAEQQQTTSDLLKSFQSISSSELSPISKRKELFKSKSKQTHHRHNHNCRANNHRRSKSQESNDIVTIWGNSGGAKTVQSDYKMNQLSTTIQQCELHVSGSANSSNKDKTDKHDNVNVHSLLGEKATTSRMKKSKNKQIRSLQKAILVRNDTGSSTALVPPPNKPLLSMPITKSKNESTAIIENPCICCSIQSDGSSVATGPVDVDSVHLLYPDDVNHVTNTEGGIVDDRRSVNAAAAVTTTNQAGSIDIHCGNETNAKGGNASSSNKNNSTNLSSTTLSLRTISMQQIVNQITSHSPSLLLFFQNAKSDAAAETCSSIEKIQSGQQQLYKEEQQQTTAALQMSLPGQILQSLPSPVGANGVLNSSNDNIEGHTENTSPSTIVATTSIDNVDDGPVDVDDFIPENLSFDNNSYDSAAIVLDEVEYSRILAGYEVGFEVETIWDYESYPRTKNKAIDNLELMTTSTRSYRHKNNIIRSSTSSIPYPIYEEEYDEDEEEDDNETMMEVAKKMELGLVVMSRHRTLSDKASI